MADLIERLMNAHPSRPGLDPEKFLAVAGEWAAGNLTGAQAQEEIQWLSGSALNPTEVAEAQAIVGTVTSIAVAGSAAQIADGKASRALQTLKIARILRLAGSPYYGHPDDVRAKLGI